MNSPAFDKFFTDRTKPLQQRFPGSYRAVVVETNDPLNMNRIRFKCPELHDWDLAPEDCPWAVPSPDMGGKKAGSFTIPVIGDTVWINFEKGHPYGPIWTGFADPTRRKQYAFPQIANISPVPVNDDGELGKRPQDYDENYLPKDGRPMAHGWVDRYGHMDLNSSVGYFPVEHDRQPAPPDHDALSGQQFEQLANHPKVNDPDKKYMARVTKYGNILLMGDQGYYWKKEGDLGEFTGNTAVDEPFETKRWLFLQRLLNDNVPRAADKDGDQRKILQITRYGSRIEMRDTGWAQQGPIQSRSRQDEFGESRILSTETENDYRWIKIRTKGGFLFQAYDKGFHPNDDKFVKRSLLQESGSKSELEDKHWGGNRDARWMRLVTRHGFKLVLDDRGSDPTDADGREAPRGNGVLIKGRRSPASKGRTVVGDQRGFMWEFNENDQANHSTWASPLGQSIEINDRYQYIMLASALGTGWVPKYRGLAENEFIRKPMMLRDPERTAHHLKIDHDNEYIRFKTRGGKGNKPDSPSNPTGVGEGEIQQGLEAHDGSRDDGPWLELVDCQRRGLWFSKQLQLGIWRSRQGRRMYQWMDERSNQIAIFNDQSNGSIVIYANRNVNVISNGDINLRADRHILMRAGGAIAMQAGGTRLTLANGNMQTNAVYRGSQIYGYVLGTMPGPGAGRPDPGGMMVNRVERPVPPTRREPSDRGKTYNGPFEECPREEVEHELG